MGRRKHDRRSARRFGLLRLFDSLAGGQRFDTRYDALIATNFLADDLDDPNPLLPGKRRPLPCSGVAYNRRDAFGLGLVTDEFAQAGLV
jgi:hypothetical protein